MKLKYLFLLLGICCSALLSCKKESQAIRDNSESASQASIEKISIGLGDKVVNQGMTVEFMELTGDSRCAEGLSCIWEGNAEVVLLVAKDSQAQTLRLNTFGDSRFPKSRTFSGYEIVLHRLHPYPRNNKEIDFNEYEVQLIIRPVQNVSGPVIIDVRTKSEYSSGHYPDALNIEYQEIAKKISQYQLAKDDEIILYCGSGKRAGKAKSFLEKAGYTNVTNGVNQAALHKTLGTKSKNNLKEP